jgi:hypothetical protein
MVSTFLGIASRESQMDLFRTQARVIEGTVASCMHRLGFEYTEFTANYVPTVDDAELLADLTDFRFATHHGFGLVDSALARPIPPQDPNSNYVLSLSDAAQRRYLVALEGDPSSGASPSGCRAEGQTAFDQVLGRRGFADAVATAAHAALSTPVVIDAARQWTSCAASAGYPFSSRRALIDSLIERIQRIGGTGGTDLASRPADSTRSALETIRAAEVAAAVATFNCSQAYDRVLAAQVDEELAVAIG